VYNALSALGVSVCFALLMKKIERDSLLVREATQFTKLGRITNMTDCISSL
jgi:hypothetical protein